MSTTTSSSTSTPSSHVDPTTTTIPTLSPRTTTAHHHVVHELPSVATSTAATGPPRSPYRINNQQQQQQPPSASHPPNVPVSPNVMEANRFRSRSVGQQPLGWSPHRKEPLSPMLRQGSVSGSTGGVCAAGKPIIQTFMPMNMTAFTSSSVGGGGGGGGSSSIIFPPHLPMSPSSQFQLEPPRISEQQRAMEAVVEKERQRAKDMEQEEKYLTADELRTVLKRERHRMARIAADLASMKSLAVQSVAEAEVSEEGRINHLMRRLDCLQQEKGRIIVELEQEEEMLTNNLQKKLDEVRREKDALEKHQMSRKELQARLKALQKGSDGEDIDMSEGVEKEEEEEMEDDE